MIVQDPGLSRLPLWPRFTNTMRPAIEILARRRWRVPADGDRDTVMQPGRHIIRDLMGLTAALGRIGDLEVRLAVTAKDIRRAQRLRYKVFFEEMSATPSAAARLVRRDKDPFDRVCDHLLVIDHKAKPKTRFGKVKPRVVGTYRLLRQDVANRTLGFYSTQEYDIEPIIARNPDQRFLELGRS